MIIDESSTLNKDARIKVLVNSSEVIDVFINKCQQQFDKDKEIVLEIEEAILNRLLSELDEEKTLQNLRTRKPATLVVG